MDTKLLTRNVIIEYFIELHKNPSDVVLSKLRINEKSEVIVLVTYIDEAVIDWFLLSNRTLVRVLYCFIK